MSFMKSNFGDLSRTAVNNENRSIVRFEERPSMMMNQSERDLTLFYHRRDAAMATRRFTSSTQTGKNLAKVRWVEDQQPQVIPDPFATEYFVSGSWGDAVNDVCLWRLSVDELDDIVGRPSAKVELVNKLGSSEDTTDMQMIGADHFVSTTTQGSLLAYKCNWNAAEGGYSSIKQSAAIKKVHAVSDTGVPATALATNDSTIVTVGEDGTISVAEISAEQFRVVLRLDAVDPVSIYCVCFVGRNELLTGNGAGQMKLWDLRHSESSLVQTMNPMNELYGAVSIAQHPSQSHLVVVGYGCGSMDLWDLRMGSGCDPVVNLCAEGGSLNEIYFHKVNPDNFFTASQTGQVWQWYPTDKNPEFLNGSIDPDLDINIEFLRHGLVFKDIHNSSFPINSINLSKNDRLICGGDSGAIFCTEVAASS